MNEILFDSDCSSLKRCLDLPSHTLGLCASELQNLPECPREFDEEAELALDSYESDQYLGCES